MVNGCGQSGKLRPERTDSPPRNSPDNWLRIEPLLPGQPGGHGGVTKDNRLFLNAVWHVAKKGIPLRNLPERFGKWDTAYHRFTVWGWSDWPRQGSGSNEIFWPPSLTGLEFRSAPLPFRDIH